MALIDIASQKQLFVDDYLIESTRHCVQMVNRAEKVAGNNSSSPTPVTRIATFRRSSRSSPPMLPAPDHRHHRR